jgi:excisionase family DNA binding protein
VASERLLTVADVAERLAVNPETVRRWLRAGRLKGFSLGSDKAGWRIREGDLAAFVSCLEHRGRSQEVTESS